MVMDHVIALWNEEDDATTKAAFLYEYVCPMIGIITLFSQTTKEKAQHFLKKYSVDPDTIDKYARDTDARRLWDKIMADYQNIKRQDYF